MATLTTVAQGSLRPSIPATWYDADGTALDLTDAALTGWIEDRLTGTTRAIQGTITPDEGTAGDFTWTLAAADVADAGTFDVQFSATWATDPPTGRTTRYLWVVQPSLVEPEQPVEYPDYQGVVTMLDRTTDPDPAAAGKVGLFVENGTLYTIDSAGVRVGPIIGDYTDAMAEAVAADAVAAHESDTTPHATLQGAIKLGGDANNYVGIAADGTVSLVGTATIWDDVRIEPTARTTGTNAPSFEQYFTNGAGSRGVYLYSFDDAAANAEKEIYFTLQLPHAWAQTAIHLHCHFIPAVTVNSSAVRWGLEYTWANPDTVFGNTAIVYESVAEGAPANMIANTHYITEFAALTPTAAQNNFSSVLIGRLFRNSSHAAELNKLGSNNEYS